MSGYHENSDRTSPDTFAPDTIPHINRAELAEAIVSELYDEVDDLVEHITKCLQMATTILPNGAKSLVQWRRLAIVLRTEIGKARGKL